MWVSFHEPPHGGAPITDTVPVEKVFMDRSNYFASSQLDYINTQYMSIFRIYLTGLFNFQKNLNQRFVIL